MREKRFYGFVDGVIPADETNSYSRRAILMDCVDADAFDNSPATLEDASALSLVRTLTTPRRWREDFAVPDVKEGDWVEFSLGKRSGRPRAWEMPASSNYEAEGSTNLLDIERHDVRPGRPLADNILKLIRAMKEPLTQVRWARLSDVAQTFRPSAVSGSRLVIEALDVGQASCVVIRVEHGPVLGFFDVGAPLYRNQKSFPANFELPACSSGFVFLSHWDFDHFDLGRRYPELRNLSWFAPPQRVGPNTKRFQKSLGGKLTFIFGDALSSGSFSFARGTSTTRNDRNGQGYTMRFEQDGEVVVLTGDVDYAFIPPPTLDGVTSITIPHHGGSGTPPPRPAGGLSRAAASYGVPNGYKHPDEAFLSYHTGLGWAVSRTATHGSLRRGVRRIFP
ncbi:hypothetical protein BN1110_04643 [bacterium YEK0313]|nr:hypothetical protein BN1110_04643 [bacterium YEK0313]